MRSAVGVCNHPQAVRSQWMAAGAETDPLERARQLQKSWERLLGEGALAAELPADATAGVRPAIVESWRRSLAAGLSPTNVRAPVDLDETEINERWLEHPLGQLAHVLEAELGALAEDSRSMVVVTDASGLVLNIDGDQRLIGRAREMGFFAGARFSEEADGTNGIGTALAAEHAVQVFAFEHFNQLHHRWVCSSAPVRDSASGRIIGLIDLSTIWKIAHPRSLELVATAAHAMERSLSDARRDQEARLRRRYGDFLTRGTDLLVDSQGYVLGRGHSGRRMRFEIPEGGGEIALEDGSAAVAESLGQGEAYLVRRPGSRRVKSTSTKGLERAEARARELADEQAALRRVATLVAREPPPSQLFAVVADQVARVFDVPLVRLIRYEADAAVVLAAFSERDDGAFPIGSRWPLDSPGVIASVRQTGRPARVEDYKTLAGEAAEAAWRVGMRSAVGSPIVVGGRLWGAIVILCPRREPLPGDTEARLADFTDLVATAIANAETRGELLRAVAEQRAQRRAATMVAAGASQVEVFTAITASASELFNAPFASLLRFGADDTATMVAGCESCSRFVGRTWSVPPQDPGIVRKVLDSGRPARIDDHSDVHGPLGEAARTLRVGSVVGVPVILDGSIWGVLAVGASEDGSPLPDDTADRLVGFTELVSASIDDTESRQKATRLLDEQAALRRVATFVAGEVGPDELFSAVSDEVAQLFEATGAAIGRFEPDGSGIEAVGLSEGLSEIAVGTRTDLGPSLASTDVYRTGRAVRREVKGDEVDDAGAIGRKLREMQVYSTVAAPITVGGQLWGVLTVVSAHASLPADTEERLQKFGELIATAIANAEGRAELAASETRARALADEQAALRRVATLVAHGISPKQLFVAVCDETAQLVNAEITTIGQFERSEPHELTVVGLSSGYSEISIGTRVPRMDWLASSAVYRTRRTSRRDVTAAQITDSNPVADSVRAMGFFSTVSAPILVEGALWGVLTASSSREALPQDTERRLESFSELIATAIANAQSRGELAASEARARALAEEQAALRRIATLVAEGATPDRVFDLVREEASRVSGIPLSILVRYDADGMATLLSTAGPLIGPVGTRFPLEGDTSAVAIVYRTGRAARVDYSDQPSPPIQGGVAEAAEEQAARWSVGVPVIVDDLLWGVLAVGAREGSPPAHAETQLGRFAGLLAMAISNANDRTELAASEAHARELANEQAALRRVATLVAQGASSDELFSAVAEEVASIIDIPVVGVHRYEDDGTFTMLGIAGETNFTVGSRWPVEGDGIAAMILDTGAPARKDDYSAMPGRLGKALREDQMIATVGVPIVVDARIWGFMAAAAKPGKPIPRDTEERLVRFTELVATAVSNATTRTDLLTSRTRLVNAADETRRRLERDLHDGIQQWLVALALKARRAAHLAATGKPATQELTGLADDLVAVTDELREISRGIHPAILTDSGLDEALKTLARRSPIRVDLDVDFLGRYDATVEATVYYVAAESITNAVKHAQASAVTIRGGRRDDSIELEIVDDGVGGADPRRGTGLIGLKDRVDTLGGTILIASPAGAGTSVRVKLPAGTRDAEHPAPRRSAKGISASTSG